MTNSKNNNNLLSLMRNKILLIIIIYLRINITLTKPELGKNDFSFLFCCQRFLTCYDFENSGFVQNKDGSLTGLAIQMRDTFNNSTSDLKTSDYYVWVMLKKAFHFSYQSTFRYCIGQMREKIEQKNKYASLYQQASRFE